jgi:hypothetical protein
VLSASRTKAVMVALAEPLEGICGRLVITETAATLAASPPLLLLLLLLLEPSVANDGLPLPPQPAAAVSAASIAIHPNLRIVFT